MTFAASLGVLPFLSSSATSHTQGMQSANAYTHMNPAPADRGLIVDRGVIRLAQTHADICLDNETQCIKGCDGFQQCTNQCEVNYQGCMSQGG